MDAGAVSGRLLEHLRAVVADLVLDVDGSVRDLGRIPPFLKPNLIQQHPSRSSLVAAVSEHPTLCALLPTADSQPQWISGYEPERLAERLINAALWHCAFETRLTSSCLDAYLRSALQSVERLVEDESVDVPVFVGFGAQLPPDGTVETPWGALKPWRPEHRWLLAGEEHDPGRGTVLVSATAVKTNIMPSRPPGTIHAVSIDDERWKRISLGFLLAQDPTTAKPTHPWFCGQAQLLGHGMVATETRRFIEGPSFDAAQLDEVGRWIKLAADTRLSVISVDRVVGMAGRIVDHVDAFIDAVIVWENLFGTGDQQELSYRVSTNMACVLTDKPPERLQLQDEIKKLYGLRSQVVHGGKHLTGAQALSARQRSQVLTLMAARRLLSEHPQLLGATPREFMAFVFGVEDSAG